MESKDKNGVYVRRHGIRLTSIKQLRNIKKTINNIKQKNKYVKDKTEVNKEIKTVKKQSTKEALIDQYITNKLTNDAYRELSARDDAADWMYDQVDRKVSNIMTSYRLTGDIKEIAKKVKRATPKEIERYNPEDPIDINDLI